MDIGQTTLAAVRASQRLQPGERVDVSHAGDVLTTRVPADRTHPLLSLDTPTGAVAVMRQLREALERTQPTATPATDWTPEWNLATIPDAQLHSELGRRRASKRTYKRQAQPPVESQPVVSE